MVWVDDQCSSCRQDAADHWWCLVNRKLLCFNYKVSCEHPECQEHNKSLFHGTGITPYTGGVVIKGNE